MPGAGWYGWKKSLALTGPVATVAGSPGDTAAGMWEGLIVVTGVPHGDVIYAPGAIERAFARRTPKGTHGPDWLRPVAIMEASEELMPSDPRLPATLPDGSPWPPEAGAVWARLRFITATADGKAALAAARRTPTAGWLLGLRTEREQPPAPGCACSTSWTSTSCGRAGCAATTGPAGRRSRA